MRVNGIKANQSFKRIEMDEDSYWNLRSTASKAEVEKLKEMSLKGCNQSYIAFDPDWGRYGSCLLKGVSSNSEEKICIPLGEKPAVQDVRSIINKLNKYV